MIENPEYEQEIERGIVEIERLKTIIRTMRKDDLDCAIYDLTAGDRPEFVEKEEIDDYRDGWNVITERIITGELKP